MSRPGLQLRCYLSASGAHQTIIFLLYPDVLRRARPSAVICQSPSQRGRGVDAPTSVRELHVNDAWLVDKPLDRGW